MASPLLPKCGQPNLGVEVHRIGLRMDMYNQWLVQKDLVGIAEKTHSKFASYLQESLEEMTQLRGANQLPSSQFHGKNIHHVFNCILFILNVFYISNVKFINSSVFLLFLFHRPG